MPALPRRTGFASAAALGGMALTVGLIHWVAPESSRAIGLDVWNLGAAEASFARAAADRDDLEAAHLQLTRQIEASENVVTLLLTDRLTLAAAVDELEAVNVGRLGFDTALVYRYPDTTTPRQRLARYAVCKAEALLARDPARWQALSVKLEAEYRVAFLPAAE